MIRVKAAFFSITPPAPPDDDGSYLRWHLLDHMVEQYQLPGIQYALRYIADGEYLDRRIVATGHLENVGNVVNYLVGDPVQQTHDDFMELGPRLAEMGRFPEVRPSLAAAHAGAVALVRVAPGADLPGGRAVPAPPRCRRDRRGAGGRRRRVRGCSGCTPTTTRRVLATPGVAGAWMYGTSNTWKLHPATQGDPQYTTVIYLDDDPLATTQALAPLVEERWESDAVRPLFAGPLRTMIEWEAWR